MRRLLTICTVALLLLGRARIADAETAVPVDLQVDLLRKLVRFERGFVARCGPVVTVIVVERSNDPASTRVVAQLETAFDRTPELAGKPVHLVVHAFSSAAVLRSTAGAAHAELLIIGPGLEPEFVAIATAFDGQPIVTATTEGSQGPNGVVVSFDLVSSKPKIVINVGQAHRQGLNFSSDLLRLARLIP